MYTAYISHPDCLKHDMGADHPECPARMHAIEDQLIATGLLPFLASHEAPIVQREALLRVHDAAYVDDIFARAPEAGVVELDLDTVMNPDSLTAALRAAGSGVMAVDLVMSGEVENAFCNVRPPGHHAGRRTAAGFCIFNNIAVAAAHALEHHGLERVAIADFDLHRGNGTEEIFLERGNVLICSTFRYPYYPYDGFVTDRAHIVNVSLAGATTGVELRAAVTEHWLPALERFKPQLILVSAGFDAHREDFDGGLGLVDADYVWLTERLMDVADRHAERRIVSMLEGGYALNALGRSAVAHIKALSGL